MTTSSSFRFYIAGQLKRAKNQCTDGVFLGLRDSLDEMASALDTTAADAQALERSAAYTATGKQQEKRKLGQQTLNVLSKIFAEGAKYKNHIEILQSSLKPSTSIPLEEKLERLFLQQEVRAELRGKDPLELTQLYRKAVASGDDTIALALESSPFELLPEEELTKGRLKRLQRLHPETSAKLEEITLASEIFDNCVQQAKRNLQEMTGVRSDPDYLETKAAGGSK